MNPTSSTLSSAVPLTISRLADDWTGVTDPALRKKLQNKLNQRALRARKRNERQKALILQSKNNGLHTRRYALILPRPDECKSTEKPHGPRSFHEAVAMMTRFDEEARKRYYAADPCLDQLFTLSKFNVLRAFMNNIMALGLGMEVMEEDVLSPFSTNAPTAPYNREIFPASLSPTTMQCSVPHHPWLDCFPFPRIRDNLVMAAESFNDCELCTDLMDPANGDIGVMVWGDPWLPHNWEVSDLFARKWSWVIEGCPEILVYSNNWRARRGLKNINLRSIAVQIKS